VQSKLPEIVEAGATHLWLPPPSASVAPQGYLPSQLYDLHSAYGDYAGLVSLNTAALAAGLRPVADVVLNHRCADQKGPEGLWNMFRDDVPHPGRRIDWGPWAITGNDPQFGGKGRDDSGENFGPSPDLDHRNEEVRGGLVDWLRWLRDYLGFEGLRLDYAKGFAPEFSREYIEKALAPGKDLCVAEFWVDAKW
jgi:alpha-amylase